MKHDPRAIEADRTDLALRLLALVERGWNIHERQGLERMHGVDTWQARDGGSFVTARTLPEAIAAAEASEAPAPPASEGERP